MMLKWLKDMHYETKAEFKEYLTCLAKTQDGENARRLYEEVFIPLVENEGVSDDNSGGIVAMAESLQSKPALIPLELRRLYEEFSDALRITGDGPMLIGRIMDTKEGAQFTGRSVKTIRKLAQNGRIKHARKMGGNWILTDVNLLPFRMVLCTAY